MKIIINKHRLNRNIVFPVISMICFLCSCGDGTGDIEKIIDNPDDYNIVYFRQALDVPSSYVFVMSLNNDTIPLNVNYGGLGYPTSDIIANIEIAPELVATYNAENGTNYPALPESGYALSDTSVLIKKGMLNSSRANLIIKTTQMLGPGSHLLPVTIRVATEGVAINEKLTTAYFLIKGKYIDNPYQRYDRTNWTISASSFNNSNSVVQNLLDDNVATYWSSGFSRTLPQEVIVDMQEHKVLHGLIIRSRGNNSDVNVPRDSGNPKSIEIQTSKDGSAWDYSQLFDLDNVIESSLYLNYFQQARYLKIIIHSSHQNMDYTWMSEVNVF